MNGPLEKVVAVRRIIAAPRAFIYRAWIDPALFAQWYGPRTWTITRCEVDVRVGGAWRAWFRRGDGGEVYAGGTYIEVVPETRLVFTWDTSSNGSDPGSLSVVHVRFADAGDGRTEVTIDHRKLGSAQALDMDAGWNNTLDSLEAFVAGSAGLEEKSNAS